MADLSLDDFIKKNNVQVKISNKSQPFKTFNSKNKGQSQRSVTRPGLKFQGPNKRVGDARQKIGTKPVGDAREKIIINRKNGIGDARNRIVHKQVKEGRYDVRQKLQRQAQKTTKQNPLGLITRTLANPGAASGVQVTNNGLQITRQIPNTQAALYGSSVKQPFKKKPPIQQPSLSLQAAVPIIQIRNDRYQPQEPQQDMYQEEQYYPSQPTYSDDYSQSYYQPVDNSRSGAGYYDLDNPMYNQAAAMPVDVSRPPPSLTHEQQPPPTHQPLKSSLFPKSGPTRVPPGAASVSLYPRQTKSAKSVQNPVIALKRRAASPAQVGSPLKLGRGSQPGIELGGSAHTTVKKSKISHQTTSSENSAAIAGVDVLSPLQGYRLLVSNLFSSVSQDDIIELFEVVGSRSMKKAKLLKSGSAEVVYANKEDAMIAVQKYNSRELDGQPMRVKMTTPLTAFVRAPITAEDPDITGEALKIYKKEKKTLPSAPIEVPTIHRALFKAGPPAFNKSVKFTVRL